VQRGANGAVNAVCHAALGACVNPEAEPDVDLPVRTKVPPSLPPWTRVITIGIMRILR
jgi:hypothetical protein